MKKLAMCPMVVFVTVCLATMGFSQSIEEIPAKERCPVCGMMVAKYAAWITQIQTSDGAIVMFDGVKDMMAYYFEPEKYGGKPTIANIYVKDYYTLEWLDGKSAYFIIGSDVLGPMGHEFIAVASMEAAENFKKDHHGTMTMTFEQITAEMVQDMRVGMKGQLMKHGK